MDVNKELNKCFKFKMKVDATQVKQELSEIESQLDRIIEKYGKVKELSNNNVSVNIKEFHMNEGSESNAESIMESMANRIKAALRRM